MSQYMGWEPLTTILRSALHRLPLQVSKHTTTSCTLCLSTLRHSCLTCSLILFDHFRIPTRFRQLTSSFCEPDKVVRRENRGESRGENRGERGEKIEERRTQPGLRMQSVSTVSREVQPGLCMQSVSTVSREVQPGQSVSQSVQSVEKYSLSCAYSQSVL